MYPRKPPTAGTETKPKKTLNFDQRQQLKKMMTEQLAKKYGINNHQLIYNQVSAYLNSNSTVTAAGLQNLQNKIKGGGAQGGKGSVGAMSMFSQIPGGQPQGNAAQSSKLSNNQKLQPINREKEAKHKKDDDEQSVKSGYSQMSGASNFDKVDQYTHKKPSETEVKETEKNNEKQLQTLNPKIPENDLAFLDEDNQWAAIYQYNNYLFQKEQDMLKQKALEQKLRLRSELDKQVRDQQNMKENNQAEEGNFVENVKIQMDMYDEREREKMEEAQRLRQAEKEARERQVKENKKQKRFETKQEKALDSFLMQKVQEELQADQKYQKFKKEHQAEIMKKLLEENQVKRERDREIAEKQRLQNIEMMNAYCRLIEKQDEERERALQERDTKMKEFQRLALENVQVSKEDKFAVMDKRRDKYERRHEQKLDQRERDRLEKERKQKQEMKEYLTKQMEQNQTKQVEQKRNFNEQALIWQNDNNHYQEYEKSQISEQEQTQKEYSEVLKRQIALNEENQKQSQATMNQNDLLLNKKLLDELERAQFEGLKA